MSRSINNSILASLTHLLSANAVVFQSDAVTKLIQQTRRLRCHLPWSSLNCNGVY